MIDIDLQIGEAILVLDKVADGLGEKRASIALRAAVKPTAEKMKMLAPRRTWKLVNLISVRKLSKSAKKKLELRGDEFGLIIGPRKDKNAYPHRGYIAHLFEKGVEPGMRPVKRRNGAATYWHPGLKRDPFMTEALESTEKLYKSRFYDSLQRHINKVSA